MTTPKNEAAFLEYHDKLAFTNLVLTNLPDLSLTVTDLCDDVDLSIVVDFNPSHTYFAFNLHFDDPTSAYDTTFIIDYNPATSNATLSDTENGLDNHEICDSIADAFAKFLAGILPIES